MMYADYNGSAPIHPAVQEYLIKRLTDGPYANPNAIHSLGKKMMFGIENCRRTLAKLLGCKSNQIIFNSGASEGITQIFHSVLGCAPSNDKNIIITSGIEHSCVVQCCELFKKKGYEIEIIKTKNNGEIDLDHFSQLLTEHRSKVALVTAMAANNETGVIQPFKEIGELTSKNNIPYFSDTTQFIGKTKFNFAESNLDYAVLSSHKVGALIGSGLIIAKDTSLLQPFILGGGQERGIRGGTQNYIGIETMAVAMQVFTDTIDKLEEVRTHRQNFENKIKAEFPNVIIIGDDAVRLASTTMISLPGIHGQAVQIELEAQNIFVTTSSACSDNEPETSKVLKAMGTSDDVGRGVVRISFCCTACDETYKNVTIALTNAYKKLGQIKSF